MSAPRASRLLRFYPPQWRERYGEELEALIVESSGGAGVSWRVRLDVARAGALERLRAAGLSGDADPGEQVRGGALLVLCAWALFVVAGAGVQRFAEHWQDVTPAASRALPSAAFTGLVVAAASAGLLVVAGIGCAVPSVARLVRAGGWSQMRRWTIAIAVLGAMAVAATVVLVIWAGSLTPRQRDGHDVAYAIAFVAWAVIAVGLLGCLTAAAVATARRVSLPARTLKVHAWLAGLISVAMVAMTVATIVWWVAIAHAAPWFLAGQAVGGRGSALAPELVVVTALMALASVLACTGAARAVRACPAISDH